MIWTQLIIEALILPVTIGIYKEVLYRDLRL